MTLLNNPTTQQPDLFPMARSNDPETSKQAAERHAATALSERRQQVLDLVVQFPGSTSGELARLMLQHYPLLPVRVAVETPHRRLSELERLGLIERGEDRPCMDSGYNSTTWRIRR